MQSATEATEKRLAAVEERLAELSVLGQKLEERLAGLSKKIEAPKDWRAMVGRLPDTKLAREADALGREIRRNQTKR